MTDERAPELELPDGWEPIYDTEGRVVGGRGPAVDLESEYLRAPESGTPEFDEWFDGRRGEATP